MDIPIVATEQYPKAFGNTVSELKLPQTEGKIQTFTKTKFSMLTPEVDTFLTSLNRKSAILCGIETHACVQQTALDLVEKGFEVHVIADGVSSGNESDKDIALDTMRPFVNLLSCEATIFELLRDAKHPNFKEISALLKEPRFSP